MKAKPLLGLVALLMVGLLATGAFAFGDGYAMRGRGPFADAFASRDFESYLEAFRARQPMDEATSNEHAARFQERAERRAAMQESREEMKEALESGDFDEWYAVVSQLDPMPSVGVGVAGNFVGKSVEVGVGVYGTFVGDSVEVAVAGGKAEIVEVSVGREGAAGGRIPLMI